MNSSIAANQAVLDELYEDLTELVRELDTETINWAPPVAQTNSIAAMVSHLVGATGRWLSHAAGDRRQGDREAELHAAATADELIALIDQARADARAWFARIEGIDPSTMRPDWRPGQHAGRSSSAAWCVQHALIHAGEHWGQIQLTRQLAAQRP
ncbi:MAG: DinB family protein [Chloroflexi bacterium]|nr:DinB family protein [Chloroflexota bacterium]